MFSKRGAKLSFRSRLPPAPLASPDAAAEDEVSLREGDLPAMSARGSRHFGRLRYQCKGME